MDLEQVDQSQQEPVTYQAPIWAHANYFLTTFAAMTLALGVYAVKVGREQSQAHYAPTQTSCKSDSVITRDAAKKTPSPLPLVGHSQTNF